MHNDFFVAYCFNSTRVRRKKWQTELQKPGSKKINILYKNSFASTENLHSIYFNTFVR